MAHTLREIFALTDDEQFGAALHDYVELRLETQSLADLADCERHLVSIRWLEMEVNNGGFHLYFYNSWGESYREAGEGLLAVGALRAAAILSQACAQFPDGSPPVDQTARQVQLPDDEAFEALDQAFYGYPDDLSALVARYCRDRRGAFERTSAT